MAAAPDGSNPSPLDELVRVVEPPLRYFATARPKRLAPNALPTERILGLVDRAAEAGGNAEVLAGLRTLFRDFPLEPEDVRHRAALQGLAELARLRSGEPGTAPAVEPPPVYESTRPEDVDAALALLASPVQFLKGVGPRRAEQMARLGIETVEHVLYHLPFRYEDRRSLSTIAELVPGAEATVVAEIVAVGTAVAGRNRRRILEARASDGSGVLTLTWFHQTSWFQQKLKIGLRVVLHGKVETGYGRKQMIHPEVEVLEGEDDELGGILPVYEKPTEMTVGAMRKVVATALAEVGGRVPSVLGAPVAARHRIVDLAAAFRAVHEPPRGADVVPLAEARSVGHRSIVFDELFYLELGMMLRKHSIAEEAGIAFRSSGELRGRLRRALPFELTGAQDRVLGEIAHDMAAPHPMNRLVQGDVGSGKTVVALMAALDAIECGYQAALMAPTEILAEQHHATVARFLAPLGIEPALLTGSLRPAARKPVLDGLARGRVPLVVGTHAIIQESVRFHRLGLGIVDEQHRFGVMQRKKLRGLGDNPDILLMTATPIPRTLAMTLYGDLDLSFLDELPPGRQPIDTRVVREKERERVYERIGAELDRGRQAYLVFPLIEDSEATDLRSAKAMARDLATGTFRGRRLALLHGQMKAEEKEAVMRRFQAGDHQILVATTVIEVGIDVPNATVMMIDHAEQFGLAQLHQLRGRVGRGAERSHCILVSTGRAGLQGFERLRLLERESRGSRIAEADLETRGPGELLGLRQSGLPDFRAANLVRDVRILEDARHEAEAQLRADPGLGASPALRRVLEHRWRGRLGLAQVG